MLGWIIAAFLLLIVAGTLVRFVLNRSSPSSSTAPTFHGGANRAIKLPSNEAPTSRVRATQAMAFHDSSIAGIRRAGKNLTVVFDYVYVLRWSRSTDGGTGWQQAAELTFADGIAHGGGDVADSLNWESTTVRTGWLFSQNSCWDSVVPAPLQIDKGRVLFVAFSLYRERLIVEGTGASLTLIGEAKYYDDNMLGYTPPPMV